MSKKISLLAGVIATLAGVCLLAFLIVKNIKVTAIDNASLISGAPGPAIEPENDPTNIVNDPSYLQKIDVDASTVIQRPEQDAKD